VFVVKKKSYYVYILGSKSGTLYTGVTNDIKRRVYEHKKHLVPGFTDQYNVEQLLYFEMLGDVNAAIGREKQIKGWRREKKVKLIDTVNPQWIDLSENWYE
jgi:putative endonuclease